MNIGLLISIREKSKRLPGKVLKIIQGQTVTEHLIDRMKLAKGLNNIIIATSTDSRDKIFGDIAQRKNINVFYGDPEDKLMRYFQVANYYNLDAVIIVDGDDILCFPEIVSETSNIMNNNYYDALFWDNLPLGAACSGLTKSALNKVIKIKDENDTEVWGGYFINDKFIYHIESPKTNIFLKPNIRLTLDYEEDFKFIECIFNELYPVNNNFSSLELMELLVYKKPHLNNINSKVHKIYFENLKKSAPVRFRKENI